jgi:hypothetical protein
MDYIQGIIQAEVSKNAQVFMENVKVNGILILDKSLAVIQIGIVITIVYFCIYYMFLSKNDTLQKIAFSYFLLLLAKIFNVLIKV